MMNNTGVTSTILFEACRALSGNPEAVFSILTYLYTTLGAEGFLGVENKRDNIILPAILIFSGVPLTKFVKSVDTNDVRLNTRVNKLVSYLKS